jgi:predicted TPR repeat methyltransferase
MQRVMRSSGDPVADRRFDFAEQLLARQDFSAAREVYEQALEQARGFAPAWFGLGVALTALADMPAASAAFREAIVADPADELGAGVELARIEGAREGAAAPRAFVKALFDSYADDFDQALTQKLGYVAPQRLAELIETQRPGSRFRNAIDLGCGTGLSGEAIATQVSRLAGVDLSSRMLEGARAKNLYDSLVEADIVEYLRASDEVFDLAFAADVFVYLGDLRPVLAALGERLSPGGAVAFSVEAAEGDGWVVQPSRRFAHSRTHIESALAAAGLSALAIEPAQLREDRGAPVDGYVVFAERPRSADPAATIDAHGTV